jgi:transcription elongation factor Elf1
MLERFSSDAIPPHEVSQTWNLHRTRELVRALTIPMAEITQTINKNISLQEQQKQDLKDALKKGVSLKLRLHLDKLEYQMHPLEQPRTVCSHYECTEYRDDKKHYKIVCHADCRVKSVQVDKIRCDELTKCRAFGHGKYENCKSCSHSWQVHLHIKWEPVEVLTKIVDEAVRQRSQENASSVEMMTQAIRSREELIQNYKCERLKIQKAAGHFAVFLKRSAITTYNDSTLEYLDHLIDEEKAKAQAGGPSKRLEGLRADWQRSISQWTVGPENVVGSETSSPP